MRIISGLWIAGLLILTGCASTGPAEDDDVTLQQAAKKTLAKVDPKATSAFEAALASIAAGDSEEAEQQLNDLSEEFPMFSGPHANLGIIYYRAGEREDAKDAFNTALELNSNNVISLNYLGIMSRQDGKFEEASTLYKKALKIDPDYAYAHLNFGILLELYMGKLSEALAHYKRYQELTPEVDQEIRKWIVDLGRRAKK